MAQLEGKVRDLTSLLEAVQQLNSEIGIEDVLNNILQQMIFVTKAEAGTLWLVNDDRNDICAKAAQGPSAEAILKIRLGLGEGIVGKVIQTSQPHLIEDVSLDPAWARRVDEASGFVTRTMMTIPLVAKGLALGAMQLVNRRDGGLFDKEDLSLASSLATPSALALHNSRMYDEISRLSISVLRTLTLTLDARDPYTAGHSGRVAKYSLWIGQGMGLDKKECSDLERAALLHDIGKIGVPDAILSKPSRLTNEEFSVMARHPEIGAQILSRMEPKRMMKMATETARWHHERLDGSGYPDRLKGDQIPLFARIVAVADAFDAMTTSRPYSRGRSFREGVEELINCRGHMFDPMAVDVMATIMEKANYQVNDREFTLIEDGDS